MNIMKLPTEKYHSVVLASTSIGWFVCFDSYENSFEKRKPLLDNNVYLITSDQIKVFKEGFDLCKKMYTNDYILTNLKEKSEWQHMSLFERITSPNLEPEQYYLSPDGKLISPKEKDLCCDNKFINKEYFCFSKRKDIGYDMGKWFKSVLSLAGINDDKEGIIVFNEKENRSIFFLSPTGEHIRHESVSLDGLTILLLTNKHACIIDNPLV